MFRRVVTALAMIPILVGVIVFPQAWLFQLLCWICIGVALYEYFSVVWGQYPIRDRIFGTLLGLFCSAWWILGKDLWVSGLTVPILIVVLGFLFFASQTSIEGAHHRIGHLVFGIFYVAGFGTHIALIRGLDDGVFWVFMLLVATWLNDTMAYFTGHWWGRHRLAPAISPGKTWEGWFGGLFGSALGIYVLWSFFPNPISLFEAGALVVLVGILGPTGDLAESLLKRSAGVKDSGHVIPGHGGMLDRIDALLFTGPLFYYFAVWVT